MITVDGKPVRARMLYVSPPDFKIFPPQPEYPFAEREEKQFELVFAPKDDIEKPLFVPNPVPRDAEFEISSLEISGANGGKTEAARATAKTAKSSNALRSGAAKNTCLKCAQIRRRKTACCSARISRAGRTGKP